jgi:hypothetical protein
MIQQFRTLILVNAFGFIGVLVTNYLANALPIAGKTTGELSDLYPNAFTPAGFTFSIWGIIYLSVLLLIIFFFQKGWKQGGAAHPYLHAIGWWFFISCLANIAWILAWHYQAVGLSLLIMLLILGSLVMVYVQLRKKAPMPEDTWTLIAVFVPFSLYLGWICVATIANTTAFLVDIGWTGGSIAGTSWAVIMMGVAIILTIAFQLKFHDWPLLLVTCWALFGISSRYLPTWEAVSITGIGGIAILALLQIYTWTQKKPYPTSIS